MKPATHPTALRVERLLSEAGVPGRVVEFEQATRTSAEAAEAIGCSVAEIAKTIVFRAGPDGPAVLVVASGDKRVCEKKVALLVGRSVGRADADFVRLSTGFAIGGVAPIGHTGPVTVILDQDLQRFDRVWAAAGTPFSVFTVTPGELQDLTGRPWSDVRLDSDTPPHPSHDPQRKVPR